MERVSKDDAKGRFTEQEPVGSHSTFLALGRSGRCLESGGLLALKEVMVFGGSRCGIWEESRQRRLVAACLGRELGWLEVGVAPAADTDIPQAEPQRVCIGKAFPKQHPEPRVLCLDMFSDNEGR